MSTIDEKAFESAIVASLTERGGYAQGQSADYNPELGLFKNEVLAFLHSTQPRSWARIAAIHGDAASRQGDYRLCQEMDLRGSLDVLRNGFTDYGVKFRMACFQPESGLNPETAELYRLNRLRVCRQIFYSSSNRNSVDLVLALNGVPVATLELKNQFTGQNADHAKRQFNHNRDSRELLFAFKKRALVHFAVDADEVWMTTRLDGSQTFWLPFNRGHNHGKGNPPATGYKTAYLWEEILRKDSLLEIVQRFVHLHVEEKQVDNRTVKKEKLIFPRFHQLDAVRKITAHVRTHGAGRNYLIQHSAGSGKSNTIAWLAYRLASLHNTADERIFDAVVLVTDRRVLDQQLQNTVYQFEHKTGVVQWIDKGSSPNLPRLYNNDKIGELPERRYAVIIDEAHSSQGGEASVKMKAALAAKSLEDAEQAEASDYDPEDEIRETVEQACAARGQHQNLSFFAFTATPKFKTLEVFGQQDSHGKAQPFHLYSMRQAIEEGFILDVLAHYTTYELYYRLSKAIEEDPQLNRKKTAQAIGRFISLHPHNLAQKTEIIIEHFRQIAARKIGGKAKAMLVTASRLHAKRYFDEFQRQIQEKSCQDIKILVAFSGKVIDDDFPDGVTEPQLTGCREKELPKVFEQDEYKILICADKFQTGFDQPLLHTMYVDKKLSGVKAVQTLSRLNRTCPGKEDTFILDFANDREAILQSFQPYYELTTVKEEPSPNHLYDLKGKLDAKQIYWQSEVEAFARLYFKADAPMNKRAQSELNACLDPAVDRYNALANQEEKDEFRKGLRTWCNLYAFMAQIMPFHEPDFEKFFAYARLLRSKLPKGDLSEQMRVTDEVSLEYYRLQKIKEGAIELAVNGEGEVIKPHGTTMPPGIGDPLALSEIIKLLNERFGTALNETDRLFFDQIESGLMQNQTLQTQAKANSMDTFKYPFDEQFERMIVERMEQNQQLFEKILGNEEFGGVVRMWMRKKVYAQMNAAAR